jgi:hypothetical protein
MGAAQAAEKVTLRRPSVRCLPLIPAFSQREKVEIVAHIGDAIRPVGGREKRSGAFGWRNLR